MIEKKLMCSVYRCSRKEGMYLYLAKGVSFDALPEGLLAQVGNPAHAMDLLLTPERKLARVSAKVVMESIADRGFFLQMPPADGEEIPQVVKAREQQPIASRSSHERH